MLSTSALLCCLGKTVTVLVVEVLSLGGEYVK